MPWRTLLLEFNGRIGRRDYWIGQVAVGLACLPLAVLAWLDTDGGLNPCWLETWRFSPSVLATLLVASIPISYCQFAIAGKRWHDRDKNAWWGMVFFIPIVGSIWYLVELGLMPGSPGANRYGAAPSASLQRRRPA
jgi:uncharacterized membrane protein YhaH (DUF805 family)